MSKVLFKIIRKCEQCPYIYAPHTALFVYCGATKREINVIEDITVIPKWCPLPNRLSKAKLHLVDADVIRKVYIVRQWDVCECETLCNCGHPSIEKMFYSKDRAEEEAKKMYKAFVEEFSVDV